jgi:hypothetical protein
VKDYKSEKTGVVGFLNGTIFRHSSWYKRNETARKTLKLSFVVPTNKMVTFVCRIAFDNCCKRGQIA